MSSPKVRAVIAARNKAEECLDELCKYSDRVAAELVEKAFYALDDAVVSLIASETKERRETHDGVGSGLHDA